MDVGVEVEVLVDGAWTPGLIIDRYISPIDVAGAVATVKFDDGTIRELSVPEDIHKCAPHIRLLSAPLDDALDVDDLTSLMELSEGNLLSALECRFRKDKIYTNTGTILLAVNPFQKVKGLYDRRVLQQYIDSFEAHAAGTATPGTRSPARRRSSQTRGSSAPRVRSTLPPHVYQVAGEAYRAMLCGINGLLADQSILVSGESGSGKTESTKFLMQYLAAQAGGAMPFNPGQSQAGIQHGIAAKVLQTNILLESFGNARTLRNDNSSRFGKFIKLHFTSSGKLTGASIQTYLLEKVRLVSQSQGERNYHIFYEMAMGASPAQRRRWCLDPPSHARMPSTSDGAQLPETMRQFLHYRYLNQSQCFKRRDGVDDREMFQRVVDALEVVGFTPFEQSGIFDLLAALMHIGNLSFEHDDSQRESSSQTMNSGGTDLAPHCIWSRDAAAHLLAVDASQLERALSVRKIRAGTDFVSVKLSAEQANNARDALAKALYGRLFDWMVGRMNEFLKMDDAQKAKGHFIGILDIFGFEVFPHNSFEQLCINFANETLQLQFNDYVFKMEQQEYEAQGVDWKYVEFLDNQDCVNLISQRPYGILPLVDEECLIPKGNDMTFASKVYKAWDDHARFSASRIQKAGGMFTIVHYAGPVEYSTRGFLEKNKDTLHQEAVDLLVYSPREGSFTRAISAGSAFQPRDKASPRQRAAANKQRGASVGWQFKEQLTALLETLQQTSPHYVRCLKPNDECQAGLFARDRVLNQLRCNGVMEAVRVARAGYPLRVPHEEFISRYFCLKRVRNPLEPEKAWSMQSLTDRQSSSSELIVQEAKELLKDLLVFLPKEHNLESQSAFEHSDQVQFATRCIAVGVQMGFTKMFLKKTTYDVLEDMRAQRLRRHMVKVFHAVLCIHARRRFLRYRHAVQSIQIAFRHRRAREQRRRHKILAIKMRYARTIQANLQMVNRRNKYQRFLAVVKMLQCRYRYRVQVRRIRRARYEHQERLAREEQARMLQRHREQQQREQQQRELEQQKEMARQQEAEKQQQQQQSVPLQYKDSYTASSPSSSEASLTSNDVEGDGYTSSTNSEDAFPAFTDGPYRKHTLKTVDESSNQLMPRKYSHQSMPPRSSQMMKQAYPMDSHGHPRGIPNRASRTFSDALHNSHQHAQAMMPHRASMAQPPRKDSFRSTRSSRAVALPRLDVVQQTQWVNDEDRFSCHICNKRFNMFKRKHHCRACGEVICNSCSLYHRIQNRSMRVCVSCVAFHSLESPTASSTKSASRGGFPSSRKTSAGSNFEANSSSNGSGNLWMNPWPEPPYPDYEEERLICLRELNIRELATSGKFNMYCEVAAKTMKCPIAYVSILEDEEQILVANIGMAHTTLPRELSFCAHTICQPNVLVVLDTKSDDRFRENPMVKGDKGAVKIRYYAGATIFSRDGHALGTVAVLDTKPRREADQEHIGMLQHLSFLASEKMMQSTIHEDSDSEIL